MTARTQGGVLGPTSHGFVSQRLRLNYVDWGNAEAPLLILVHGGQDHARSWDWVAQELRGAWHVIAPDLRGHGDSAWSMDGAYMAPFFVYDLAQLVHQQAAGPVHIVGHSLGAAIAVRYAGIFPERVAQLVAIEGLTPPAARRSEQLAMPTAQRWQRWIDDRQMLARRQPRRYATIAEAGARMQAENRFLSPEQARHLTEHGVNRNEDGTYSWKFDNYVRNWPPSDITDQELQGLWGRITCPTLLAYGRDSWASNPAEDGRAAYFRNAEVVMFDGAGHWLHHDQFETFMQVLRRFLVA